MTSFELKVIALVAMTIDHITNTIGQMGLMELFPSLSLQTSYQISKVLGFIGRLAFPIFAFLVGEGAAKTKNIWKYFGRLTIFAIISVPIFSFSHVGVPKTFNSFLSCCREFSLNNVLFTFAISMAVIIAFRYLKQYIHNKKTFYVVSLCVFILGCVFAEVEHTDYGAGGVFLVVILHLVKSSRAKICTIILWSFGFYGFSMLIGAFKPTQIIFALTQALGSSLACIPIAFYNGKRGASCQWFFYVYYPAHLLALSVIAGLLA